MESKRFLTAQDVMEMLGVSLSYSYKLILLDFIGVAAKLMP